LKNNPYFDKIFPDLAKHKQPTTSKFSEDEFGYIDSLKSHYKSSQKYLTLSEVD
jgi:hypothetical protein